MIEASNIWISCTNIVLDNYKHCLSVLHTLLCIWFRYCKWLPSQKMSLKRFGLLRSDFFKKKNLPSGGRLLSKWRPWRCCRHPPWAQFSCFEALTKSLFLFDFKAGLSGLKQVMGRFMMFLWRWSAFDLSSTALWRLSHDSSLRAVFSGRFFRVFSGTSTLFADLSTNL